MDRFGDGGVASTPLRISASHPRGTPQLFMMHLELIGKSVERLQRMM
jgi:hypothetical protein